jgi:hypothetical protein
VALGAWRVGPRGSEANRAVIGAQLVGLPPPGIIFAPGRGPAVLVGLHTADHIRLASPVQEAQHATAPGDRTRIVGVAIGEEHDALALLFEDRGERIFSLMLRAHKGLLS